MEENNLKYNINSAKEIYKNKLSCYDDVKNFILEGEAIISFKNGKMIMENAIDPASDKNPNFVFWCDKVFPSDILIEWQFKPIREPGLCMMFFSAAGKNGKSIFDKSITQRTGDYPQYHHGDINAFHVSYFRRKKQEERAFHTCNLRKSYGFHLVAQGGDPVPDVKDISDMYTCTVIKKNNVVKFFINELEIFSFEDNGVKYGEFLKGGNIGFRQMAPLIAEYSNLKVYEI